MILLDQDTILNAIRKAHAKAHAYCRGMLLQEIAHVSSNIAEYIEYIYSDRFLDNFLDMVIVEYARTDNSGWTIRELAEKLASAGLDVVTDTYSRTTSLEIGFGLNHIHLDDGGYEKTLIWYGDERRMERWDQDVVDMLLIVKNELDPVGLQNRTEDLVRHFTVRKKEYDVMMATILGIIREKFKDIEYTVHNEQILQEDIFKCEIDTGWGKIDMECRLDELNELGDRLDSILQQKQDFDVLTSGLLDENY